MIKTSFFFGLWLLAAPALHGLFLVDVQKDIVEPAQDLRGTRYVYGGAAPGGFDCSGLIKFLYKDFSLNLPRSSRDLGTVGKAVPLAEARAGDLLFFATGRDPRVISHVALYIGQNSMIHAASAGPHTGVILTDIEEKYWRSRLVSVRRLSWPAEAEVAWGLRGDTYAVEFARGRYEGEIAGGEPEGRGKMVLKNGDVYQGQFKDGLFSGQGVYQWKSGGSYSGQFVAGKMTGRGVLKYASGARYEGQFANLVETGGWYTAPDGQRAWAASENGVLKFWTDDSMTASAAVTGPKLATARALTGKAKNALLQAGSEWDNFVGSDWPEDWER